MEYLQSLRSLRKKAAQASSRAVSAFLKWPHWLRQVLVFGGSLLVFNALGATSYLTFRWHVESFHHAAPKALEVLAPLEEASSLVQAARAQGQDYLATGRNGSLLGYQESLQRLGQDLERLKSLGVDQAALKKLKSLVDQQLPLSFRLAELRKSKGQGTVILGMRIQAAGAQSEKGVAMALVKAKEEENLSKITGILLSLREEYRRRLDHAERDAAAAFRVFIGSIALGNLLAIALVAWAGHALMYHMKLGELSSRSLAQMQSYMDSTAEAVFGIDLEGNCTFANRACLRLLGYEEAGKLLGKHMSGLVILGETPGEKEGAHSRLLQALHAEKNLHVEDAQAWRSDGTLLPVECWSGLIYEGGMVSGAVVTLLDISKPKAAREALEMLNERLQNEVQDLSQHSREMTAFGQLTELLQASTSREELCRVISLYARELFPGDAGSLYVQDPSERMLAPMASWGEGTADSQPFEPEACWSVRRGKPHYEEGGQGLYCAHVPKGHKGFSYCLPLSAQGGTLGVLHFRSGKAGMESLTDSRQLLALALAQQIALGLSNLSLREKLREDAIRDPLTGLFNRRYMKEALDHEMKQAQRRSNGLSLLLFDLDHFKEVNDSRGHAAGDSLLKALGEMTRGHLRGQDIPCRLGGDEFLLILPGTGPEAARTLAQGLCDKAARLCQDLAPGLDPPVTLSAGLASSPEDAATPDELLKAADKALYRAKGRGRNCVCAAGDLQVRRREA